MTGWQKPEYEQMGPVGPADEFFGTRYQYLGEYAQVLRDLWSTGRSDFKGEHFHHAGTAASSPRRRRLT